MLLTADLIRDFENLKDLGLFNVMYLTPIPERIKEISEVEADKINTGGGITKFGNTSY